MTQFGELVIVPDGSILDFVGFRWISLDLPPKRSSTGELLGRDPVHEAYLRIDGVNGLRDIFFNLEASELA